MLGERERAERVAALVTRGRNLLVAFSAAEAFRLGSRRPPTRGHGAHSPSKTGVNALSLRALRTLHAGNQLFRADQREHGALRVVALRDPAAAGNLHRAVAD